MLTRAGNKRKIADKIYPIFPRHDLFIDMFFGAGGMFFSKPQAPYNICNDTDSDVFNLFMVLKNNSAEFTEALGCMPVSQDLFKYWRKTKETDSILKAVRFVFLSNFSLYGKSDTLKISIDNTKKIALRSISAIQDRIKYATFTNFDFRVLLDKIAMYDTKAERERVFIYADPPYLDTANPYEGNWSLKDTEDVFIVLVNSGYNFAISEFDHPKIIEMANDYGLNIHTIGERRAIKNRRTEILMCNYETNFLTKKQLF